MLNQHKMNKSKLVKVTEQLVAENGDLITLNGAVFLNLTNEGETTTQRVYIPTKVKNMLLSLTACKEFGLVTEEFPNSTAQPDIAECTATEDGRRCDLQKKCQRNRA